MRPPGRHGARPAPSAKGAPRAGCPWSARTQPGSARAAGRAALRSCVRLSWLGETVPRDLLRVTNSASQVEVLSPAPHGLDALQQQLQVLVAGDRVQVFTVDDQHRRRIVLMKEGRVAFGQRPQVRLGDTRGRWPKATRPTFINTMRRRC